MRRSGQEGLHDRKSWQPVRPAFDNPLSWAVPLGRITSVRLAVHVALPIFIVIECLRHLPPPRASAIDPKDIRLAALMLGCVLVAMTARVGAGIVAGRLLACPLREVVVWPLGILRSREAAEPWRHAFLIAAAGPTAGIAIFLLGAPLLALLTGVWWTVAIPSPLHPPGIGDLTIDGRQPLWLLAVGTLHRVNFIMLLLSLMPIEPLDGTRIVRAVARRFLPPGNATIFAGRLGVLASIPLLAMGIVIGSWILMTLAAVGAAAGLYRLRNEAWLVEELGAVATGEVSGSGGSSDSDHRRRDFVGRRRRAPESVSADRQDVEKHALDHAVIDETEPNEAAELDRVLERIARHGMKSLDEEERAILRRSTERRRGEPLR